MYKHPVMRGTHYYSVINQTSSHLSNPIFYYSPAPPSTPRSKHFFNTLACTTLNLSFQDTASSIFVFVFPNQNISILQFLSRGPSFSEGFLGLIQLKQTSLPMKLLPHFQFAMIIFFLKAFYRF